MDTSEAAALPAAPATGVAAPPASSSELQPTVAGRLDCLGAAASMRHVREQGAYTKLHDTFHNPVGGGSAELAIGNWMLALCGVLIEPSVASHWTGKNDDAPGSFVESWIVTLRQRRCQQPKFD